jgi:hypothetical protein
MSTNDQEPHTETLAESENFNIWKAEEPDGETTYHLELGQATLHFFQEEWNEFLEFIDTLDQVAPDENGLYTLEFDNVDVWLDEDDWTEFCKMAREAKNG